jgi:hypothetical protein
MVVAVVGVVVGATQNILEYGLIVRRFKIIT